MSDIVERLRDKHCCDDTCHCDEAAAEIERLRAALKEIAEGGVFSFGLSFDPDGSDPMALQGEQRFVLLRDVKAIAQRARAALGGDNG